MKTKCLHGVYMVVKVAANKQDNTVSCVSVVISVKENKRVGEGDMEQMTCLAIPDGKEVTLE